MKWSGRFVQVNQPPWWIAVEAETESEAEDKLLPATPAGWTLDGISRGDQTDAPTDAPPSRKGQERKGRK